MKRLGALFIFLLAAIAPAYATNTTVQWGATKGTPWTVCLYDSSNVCQAVFTLPSTGGGALVLSANGGTGVNNGSSTMTIGGNLSTAGAVTLSGAYTLAITLTGATTLTFPTSGSLAATGTIQTWTAAQTFNANDFILGGVASGTQCLHANSSGIVTGTGSDCGTPGVTSLGNASADTSLTVAGTGSGPWTGTVTAKLNLGNAQTWTGAQTFTDSDFLLKGSSSGALTLKAPAAASTYIATLAANTGTIAELNFAQTWSAAQTFGEVLGTVNPQVGTTYTLAATDCGTEVTVTNASAITVTIPATLPLGCNISVLQGGAGQITMTGSAVTAATLHSAHSYTKTYGQWAIVGVNIEANSGGSSAIAILTGDGA